MCVCASVCACVCVSATYLAAAGQLQAKIADINEKLRQSISAELEREERRAVEVVKNN